MHMMIPCRNSGGISAASFLNMMAGFHAGSFPNILYKVAWMPSIPVAAGLSFFIATRISCPTISTSDLHSGNMVVSSFGIDWRRAAHAF